MQVRAEKLRGTGTARRAPLVTWARWWETHRLRRFPGPATLLLGVLVLASACGGSNDADQAQPAPPATAAAAATTAAAAAAGSSVPALVGRWERVNRCTELVQALADEGLGAIAPAMVGDYFPGASPEELAQRDDVCEGAEPIVHAHFFDAAGRFGSLDGEEQVDDGTYEIVDDRTFVISKEFPDVTFHYAIEGDTLTITPVVTEAMKREALARPHDFSPAGWATSMSYPRSGVEAGRLRQLVLGDPAARRFRPRGGDA